MKKRKFLSLKNIPRIKALFNKVLTDFNDEQFVRISKLFIIMALLVIAYASVYSGFQVVDEFEHLHASWLVSIGKLPYRDFFEHHNPLLWYLSAPIVSLFYDDAIIFYVMRGVSFVFSLLLLYYIYKIALFFSSKKGAYFSLVLYLGNIITLYNFYQFRPDNFMNLFFIIGLYYLFLYLEKREVKTLSISFLSFLISSLFLQKILLLLFVMEAILLVLIIRKKMSFKDVLIASLPTLFVSFIFLAFLYKKDILLEYIELNYYFNQDMVFYFARGSFWLTDIFYSWYAVSFIMAILYYKEQNLYFRIIAILCCAEFLMRAFYFAPHPNYYTLLTAISCLVLAPLSDLLFRKTKPVCLILFILLFIQLGRLFNTVETTSTRHNSFSHYQLAKYVHQNSTKDDYVLNGYDMIFNIYRNDLNYYWFGLDMLWPLSKQRYDLKDNFDINNFIIEYRPKFIYAADYFDLLALRRYGETKYSQRFNLTLIKKLYEPTTFPNLMILKN